MAAILNPKIARVVMEFFRDTRIMENVWHLVRSDGSDITLANLQDAGQAVISWWNAAGKALASGTVSLDRAIATKLSASDPLQYITDVGVNGTNPNAPLPADATLAVGLRTGLAGRKYRGRMYQNGVCSNQTTVLDQVTSTALAQYVASMADLAGQLFTYGLEQVIYHRASGLFTPVNNWIADANLDSQRNRLPGRGI